MKMRDHDELVKALMCCVDGSCEGCPRLQTPEPESEFDCMNKLKTDAADAIEELVAAVPKWISVEERLPDDQCDDARAARGGDYIHKVLAVSVTPNYTAMDTAYLYNGRWALGQYTSWKHFMGAPVTHWMPLPDPPKEVV